MNPITFLKLFCQTCDKVNISKVYFKIQMIWYQNAISFLKIFFHNHSHFHPIIYSHRILYFYCKKSYRFVFGNQFLLFLHLFQVLTNCYFHSFHNILDIISNDNNKWNANITRQKSFLALSKCFYPCSRYIFNNYQVDNNIKEQNIIGICFQLRLLASFSFSLEVAGIFHS